MLKVEVMTDVTKRFFIVLYGLIRMDKLKSKKAFCEKYSIGRANFRKVEAFAKDETAFTQSYNVQLDWLVFIAKDYKVSPDYLLLGKGKLFKTKKLNELFEATKNAPNRKFSCDHEALPDASFNPFGYKNRQN